MEPGGRRGSTSATSTIHGEILHFEAVARQARDRFQELTRGAVPHVNPLWGRRWLLKELFRNGYRFERNAKSGDGVIYRNPDTGSEAELYRYPAKAVAKREHRERLLCFERRLL